MQTHPLLASGGAPVSLRPTAPRRAARLAVAAYATRDARTNATAAPPAPVADAATPLSKCPFAKVATLFTPVKSAPAPGTPVGLPGMSPAENAADLNPHSWLSARQPGQDRPGRLVSGMKKLDLNEWLLENPEEMPFELGLKKRALDDPARRPPLIACEPGSVFAQAELLEMFLEHLPRVYPSLYRVEGEGQDRRVSVVPTGDVYRVGDFEACPLELCNRLVQEDLALVRPDPPPGEGAAPPPKAASLPHVMSAAVVVFSFGDLHEKLGQPLLFIHGPVPGFEKELNGLLSRAFTSLAPETPLWRNNWAFANNGDLDRPVYGTEDSFVTRLEAAKLAPEERFLKTEYQTLRKLPLSGHLLFTVRTYVEALSELKGQPIAAATLASSLRGLTREMQAYKGLPTENDAEKILSYLDGIANQA